DQIQLASSPGGSMFSGLDGADQLLTNGADFNPFPFVLNAVHPNRMLLANNGLYISVEKDSQGHPIPTGDVIRDISPAHTGTFLVPAYGVPSNDGVIYVATTTGELYVHSTANGGFSQAQTPWATTSFFSFSGAIIVIDPNDYHTAYVLDIA